MNTKPYSDLDKEIIVLAAAWDLIGSMVHYGHFVKSDPTQNTILMFNSREASKLFSILLADFLSLPRPGVFGLSKPKGKGAIGETFLCHLQQIVDNPFLGEDKTLLSSSINAFAEWLDGFANVKNVWLPSIDRNDTLVVRRMTYLKICGTTSKHGFTRLGDIVKKIIKILEENGTVIDEGQGYLVIPEFQEWFGDNVFLTSSTLIAWHLNEIRWGIYNYLSREFQRSYRQTVVISNAQMYTYDAPAELTNNLVRSMYWDLMNEMRSIPYFPRFNVNQSVRNAY